MRLSPKYGNGGHVTSYTLNVGSREAREAGFIREDGSRRELKKIIDTEHNTITFTIDWNAEEQQNHD